jgi:L-ascorbate metabolism protein UlaG (beta-lactamase superfamily)
MLEGIKVFRQNSIKIVKDKVIYIDPFKIADVFNDADIIFITHDHYDHYDVASIKNIMNSNTYIVIPNSLKEEVLSYFTSDKVLVVDPNKNYELLGIRFDTIPSYNINKKFHPKENNWIGYLINLDNYSYYIMGDTDDTLEARNVKADVLFIPIGGTYTMNKEEAVTYTNYVKPKYVIPVHYKEVVGTDEDAKYFINNLDSDIKGVILIP